MPPEEQAVRNRGVQHRGVSAKARRAEPGAMRLILLGNANPPLPFGLLLRAELRISQNHP